MPAVLAAVGCAVIPLLSCSSSGGGGRDGSSRGSSGRGSSGRYAGGRDARVGGGWGIGHDG